MIKKKKSNYTFSSVKMLDYQSRENSRQNYSGCYEQKNCMHLSEESYAGETLQKQLLRAIENSLLNG